MRNKHDQTIVYLLSTSKTKNTDLKQQLQNCHELVLKEVELKNIPMLNTHPHRYIILVDAKLPSNTLLSLVKSPLLEQADASVLFNAPTQPDLRLLSLWTPLAGYFNQMDKLEDIIHGVLSICRGDTCLPHNLLLQVFQYWQSRHMSNHSLTKQQLALTKREIEILQQLQLEHSNLEIANQLAVSERTIKSHLYHIFKKIKVKNRRQAAHWAKLYL